MGIFYDKIKTTSILDALAYARSQKAVGFELHGLPYVVGVIRDTLVSNDEQCIESIADEWFEVGEIASFRDKIKVRSGFETLLSLPRRIKLIDGAAILTEEEYNHINADEIDRKNMNTFHALTRNEALEHPLWWAMYKNDKKKLSSDVNMVFDYINNTRDNSIEWKGMGVYLRSEGDEKPVIRSLSLLRLRNGLGLSAGANLNGPSNFIGTYDENLYSLQQQLEDDEIDGFLKKLMFWRDLHA